MFHGASKFFPSEFACKCGCGFGLQEEHVAKLLVEKLANIRAALQQPIIINSAARCAKHNLDEGGKEYSAHLAAPDLEPFERQSRAVDVAVTNNQYRQQILELAILYGFKRIGIAKTFIHLDIAKGTHWPNAIWVY